MSEIKQLLEDALIHLNKPSLQNDDNVKCAVDFIKAAMEKPRFQVCAFGNDDINRARLVRIKFLKRSLAIKDRALELACNRINIINQDSCLDNLDVEYHGILAEQCGDYIQQATAEITEGNDENVQSNN